jgi:trehalose 6-phosphate synthase
VSIQKKADAGFSELIHADHIIIASNRGPIETYMNQNKTLKYRLGPGGLVTALSRAAHLMEATWVAMAMTEGDHIAVQKAQQENNGVLQSPQYNQKMRLRYVSIQEDIFRKYYGSISTELLWFTYSNMYHLAKELSTDEEITDAWANGYCVANRAIAEAIINEIARKTTSTVVLLQDFFLGLVSSLIRERYPSVLIHQFLHWPWPDIRYLYQLPSHIVRALYEGLAGNDIIGFQTERDVHNFLDGAGNVLEGASIDFESGMLSWRGRTLLARMYPISISVAEERRLAYSLRGEQEVKKLQPFLSNKIIMRVDRLDPVKNIIIGFQAYAQLLEDHPELLGQVTFLAFLVPTREAAPVYQKYKTEVFKIVEEINQKYGSNGWLPIHTFYGNDRTRALAGMRLYDVLLVNPIIDSMNLVAKEGVVVNQRDGILVLSRTAGAFSRLGKTSIPISPTNMMEIAQALYRALMLSPEERATKATLAQQEVEQHDLNDWLTRQIRDINTLLGNI